MKLPNKRVLAALLVLAPTSVWATNGMFMIGYGAKSVAMGGTAIANPQDSLAGATNPATIGEVGMRVDAGADIFLPSAKATVELGQPSATTADSAASHFLIPNMGGAMPFNRKIAFGFSAVGAGGGGTRYNTNLYNVGKGATAEKETLGVSLMFMQMNPTVAYKLNRQNTLGASLVMGIAQFRAFGLDNFATFTSTQTPLPARGNDWAYGAGVRLGWLGKYFSDKLMLGVMATSRVYMSKFKKYDELFAEQGAMDTPPNFGAGLSYKLTDKLTMAFDVSETLYKSIRSISNPGPNPTGGPQGPWPVDQATNSLGRDQGLGFGWRNQTVYKLGVAYAYDDRWTLRAGWNYGKSPIPANNGAILFNILAPAVTQNHLTLGAGYALDGNKEVNVSYMHAFRYTEYGPTYIVGPRSQIGMAQNAIGVNFGMKF